MRIDKLSVLVGGADAVRVAVGAEAGVAAVGDNRLAEGADMRLDGLGVNARKEWVDVAANLHVSHANAGEDVRDDGAARAVHGVYAELHAGAGDEVEIGKALNGIE